LAKLHISGNSCGGVSDLYYVTAVSIKQLVDSYPTHTEDILSDKTFFQNKLTAHTTLLTLLSDSGYHDEAEVHLIEALRLNPSDSNLLISMNHFDICFDIIYYDSIQYYKIILYYTYLCF
jgi:hypothetical protein